jgi:hypothetical protein
MASSRHNMMVNLANKINNIHDKRILFLIVKIIRENDPNVPFTENDNGMFIKFNLLSSVTHNKILSLLHDENIIQKIDI